METKNNTEKIDNYDSFRESARHMLSTMRDLCDTADEIAKFAAKYSKGIVDNDKSTQEFNHAMMMAAGSIADMIGWVEFQNAIERD